MKRLRTIFLNKRGEGYIDVVVSVLVCIMLLVLSINVFSFLTVKQDLDYFAKEMIFTSTSYGKTIGEVDIRYNELVTETRLTPYVSWKTSYYDSSLQTIQLGDTIKLTITYKTSLHGFGIAKIPITLTATHSGLSQKYWK